MDYPNSTMQNQPTNQPDYISPPLPSREKKEEKKRKTTTVMTIHTFTHHPTSSLPITTTTACPGPTPVHLTPLHNCHTNPLPKNHGILYRKQILETPPLPKHSTRCFPLTMTSTTPVVQYPSEESPSVPPPPKVPLIINSSARPSVFGMG